MRIKNYTLLLLCLITIFACKRKPDYHPIKNIGDVAPTPRLKKWLKGEPIEDFEKGKIYVVEFWATWCAPCKASMPHLSALAKQYKSALEEQIGDKINKYAGFWNNNLQKHDFGYPDSALLVIDSAVKKTPLLKYQPFTAYFTLFYQLKANRLADAYQYGRQAIAANVNDKQSQYSNLIAAIRYIKENYPKIKITPEIYQIAAESQQKLLDNQPYPELVDIPSKYKKIAMWCRLAGDKVKAMEAEEKALNYKN